MNFDATLNIYSVAPLLEKLLHKTDLSAAEAHELMAAIIAGNVPPASVAAIAIALRAKGESVHELAACAAVMREKAVRIQSPAGTLDTCGTGGDRSQTFNISTATALVAAGMGIPVAKHGGRAASSTSGSADVFAALGVKVDVPPECVERCIRDAGVGFLFAPNFHPGMKHVSAVRRELGVRTIFNLLGPLSNPAGARLQLLGVSEPALCVKFAEVLRELRCKEAMIVCGAGTGTPAGSGGALYLDEVSTFGPTTIARLSSGSVEIQKIDPRDLSLPLGNAREMAASGPQQSAEIIRGVLRGQRGSARDIVALNAAAAAMLAGQAADWAAGLELAQTALDDGRAMKALETLVAITNGN